MFYSAMKNQQGFNTVAFLLWMMAIIMAIIMGMRVIPAYMEHATIQKALNSMTSEPDINNKTSKEIRQSFNKFVQIDDIESVSGRDLEIKKVQGNIIIEVAYSVKTPLFANISLLLEFEATAGN